MHPKTLKKLDGAGAGAGMLGIPLELMGLRAPALLSRLTAGTVFSIHLVFVQCMQNLHGHLATPQVLTYRLPYLQPTLPTAYLTYPLSHHHHHHHHHHRSAIFVQTLSRIAGIADNDFSGRKSKSAARARARARARPYHHAKVHSKESDLAVGPQV